LARAVTAGGALAGAAIGVAIAIGAGLPAWCLLLVMFAIVVVATKLAARKRAPQSAALGERRAAGNAFANTGLAAMAALVFFVTGWWAARVSLAAALIVSGSDTVASEAGQGWGKTTWHLRHGFVPPGTTGGMSIVGTVAGLTSVACLTIFGTVLGVITWDEVGAVGGGASLAFLVEGALISTLEEHGWLDNDDVNLLATVVAAISAVGLHASL
jgi:uncharacterized protein (TIGR00297 family)